jgi:hypothetical protein
MTLGEKPAAISPIISFSELVDDACDRLMDRQIKYSIQRIQKMEECLAAMEQELDEFLFKKNRKLK